MMYDGKLLALARAGLEKDREANRSEQQRRIDLAYHQIPELEQIDLALRSHMAELVRLTLSKPTDLQDRIHELQKARPQEQDPDKDGRLSPEPFHSWSTTDLTRAKMASGGSMRPFSSEQSMRRKRGSLRVSATYISRTVFWKAMEAS